MATRTVRTQDGRNITIDTETGKEVKPFEGNLKFLKDFANAVGLTTLPENLPKMVDRLTQDVYNLPGDIGPNLVYSDQTDNKGRPLTLAQAANREKALANFMRGGKGGEFDVSSRKAGEELQEKNISLEPGKDSKIIEVTGADGKTVRLDMSNPADVARLQKIQPKLPVAAAPAPPNPNPPFDPPAPPPVDLRGPSAADLLAKNNKDKTAAENEGMRIWAEKFGDLAAQVKPNQAGYEVIQDVLKTDNTGAAISPFAQAFADQKIGEMFTDNRFADTFTNSINLQNPLQGFELDAAAPYSNADLGDIDFLSTMEMPSLLTSPGQSFEIPQAVIDKAKAMPFDPNNPTKEDPDYAAARDAQISNYMATRTTKPVFDEATQSWKQVPISR